VRQSPWHKCPKWPPDAQYRLLDGETISVTKQSKHHRWRLEDSQIRQYQLGGIFDDEFAGNGRHDHTLMIALTIAVLVFLFSC